MTKGGELFLRCSIVNLGKNLVSWLFNGLPISEFYLFSRKNLKNNKKKGLD